MLEVEQVGVNDKFFELGGNSLKSLKLLAAVNQRFSCQLAVVDIFKFSTVKTLSSQIE
ncbi:Surfactin synthase subunit 1 [compost metagenome]